METDPFLQRFEERRAAREAADRSFQIAGATLTYRPTVAPEVGIQLEQIRTKVIDQMTAVQNAVAKAEKDVEKNGGETKIDGLNAALDLVTITDADMLQVADETVIACLVPESHQAWADLRSSKAEQPLTFSEVFEIADYLLGRVAGIPTSAPADSSAGRTPTAKRSKADSSSQAKTPAASH